MALEIRPDVSAPERSVLASALARAGAVSDGLPPAYATAWLRAALSEAVDDETCVEPLTGSYGLSPRSTRGATRA